MNHPSSGRKFAFWNLVGMILNTLPTEPMNLPRKLPLLVRFASFRGLEESKAVWLCLLMTLGFCRICVGRTIPSWFLKAQPLPPPPGEVIRVGTADELLAAVDRLSTGGTILLADRVTEDIRGRARTRTPDLGAWESEKEL